MVKRKSIGASPGERLVDLLREAREGASAGHTTPAGNKVLEFGENVYWGGYDPFGDAKDYSIRDVAEDLDQSQLRIEEARVALEKTQARLDDAVVASKDVQSKLDTLETVTIPDAVAALVAVDEAAAIEMSALDTLLTATRADVAQATIDAADAHNVAVAAQATVESLRDSVSSGPSLFPDPSFETSQGGVVRLLSGRIDRTQEWARSGTWSIKYTANGNDGNNYGTYGYVEITPGSWYSLSMTVKAGAAQQRIATGWDARTANNSDSASFLKYLIYGADGYVTPAPNEMITRTWFFQAPTGATHLRYWIGQQAEYNKASNVGQVVYLDDLRLVDVSDTYPKLLAAEKAAKEAQERADEAYAAAESKADQSDIDSAIEASRAEVTTEIRASANGKNSITISSSAAGSIPGVVNGDLWWRVDGSGQVFAQWTWSGSAWTSSTIRNEMIANLDVNKLVVSGSAKIASAVMDKLWVDGLSARSVITARLAVASGNSYLYPGFKGWTGGGTVSVGAGFGGTDALYVPPGSTTRGFYDHLSDPKNATPVSPGRKYAITAYAKSGSTVSGGMRVYGRWYDKDGNPTSASEYLFVTDVGGIGGEWVKIEQVRKAPDNAATLSLGFYATAAQPGGTFFSTPFLQAQVGSVLIEDGAITTPKITVTEDLSAKVVSAMTTESKKLVVTEEAILNHATLLGQTVVDSINVQGKLIGGDGVFTGTVDAEKIVGGEFTGEVFYGGSFRGAEFRTSDTAVGDVILSDVGYVAPDGTTGPGIQVIPPNASKYTHPPSIGPRDDSMILSGGAKSDGGRAYITLEPERLLLTAIGPGARSTINSSNLNTYMQYQGTENRFAELYVGNQTAHAQAAQDNVTTSSIRVYQRSAWLYSRKPDGGHRYLVVDDTGTWVKENGFPDIDVTSAYRSEWTPANYPSGYRHPHGTPFSYNRIGKRIFWRGRFAKTNGAIFKAGEWVSFYTLSSSFRPQYATGLATPASGTALARIEVLPDTGVMKFVPTEDTSWISLDGLYYDTP